MIAAVTAAAATPHGHLHVSVRCPWCRRIHHHWLPHGHSSDYQTPACGTPSSYWISTALIETAQQR